MALGQARAHVDHARPPLSMYIGRDEGLLAMDVEFDAEASADEVAGTVEAIEHEISERYPRINRIYIEARRGGSVAPKLRMEA